MSIVTKTGDSGTTGLMYNRRVPKHHARVEAYGCVDELNAALGVVRALSRGAKRRGRIRGIQENLIILMGELATEPRDLPKYRRNGFAIVTAAMTKELDLLAVELEANQPVLKGWAIPGETAEAAAFDLARTTCRRAERRVCELHRGAKQANSEIVVYLNRLADILWLLAREAEER